MSVTVNIYASCCPKSYTYKHTEGTYPSHFVNFAMNSFYENNYKYGGRDTTQYITRKIEMDGQLLTGNPILYYGTASDSNYNHTIDVYLERYVPHK
jgi:hypothetical protein